MSESIQDFFWDLYWQGRLLTPLKHRGFSAFSITNMDSFSLTPFLAARPVQRILLIFSPVHCSSFRWKGFCWKLLVKLTKLISVVNISQFISWGDRGQMGLLPSCCHFHCARYFLAWTLQKTTCLFFHRSSHPSET